MVTAKELWFQDRKARKAHRQEQAKLRKEQKVTTDKILGRYIDPIEQAKQAAIKKASDEVWQKDHKERMLIRKRFLNFWGGS